MSGLDLNSLDSVNDRLWFIPLGGMFQVGNNCGLIVDPQTRIATATDAGIIVQRGDVFGGRSAGVNECMPDYEPLRRLLREKIVKRIRAMVATHLHMDHLAGVSQFCAEFDAPAILSRATYDVLLSRCEDDVARELRGDFGRFPRNETEQAIWDTQFRRRLVEVLPKNLRHRAGFNDKTSLIEHGQMFQSGNFNVTALSLNHSAVGTMMLLFEGNGVRVCCFPDHRFSGYNQEETNTYENLLYRIREQGQVDLMIVDALNSSTPGHTENEEEIVKNTIEEMKIEFGKGQRRVFLTFHASIERRYRELYQAIKEEFRLTPGFLGRAMESAAIRYGYEATLPDRSSRVIFITGCQLEGDDGRQSMLYKMFLAEEKDQNLVPFTPGQGDSVVFVSRVIPGNGGAMKAGIAMMAKAHEDGADEGARIILNAGEVGRLGLEGVENIREARKPIHVSGHGRMEDHKREFAILEPKVVIPTHTNREESAAMAGLLPPCSKLVLVGNGEAFKL